MPTSDHHKDIEFGGPATYRIVVQGDLSADWSDRLGGLAITATSQAGRIPQTTLVGQHPRPSRAERRARNPLFASPADPQGGADRRRSMNIAEITFGKET